MIGIISASLVYLTDKLFSIVFRLLMMGHNGALTSVYLRHIYLIKL
jgi:hypothetical protein